MTSTVSSPRRIEKVSSDNIVISFDLLSNLTYMAALAAAELPREEILRRAGEQHRLKPTFPISTLQGWPQSATELPNGAE